MGTEYRFRDNNNELRRKVVLAGDEILVVDEDDNVVIPIEEYIYIPIPIPDSNQSGLAADSTGVKWTSNFKFKINTDRLVGVVLRASWSASESDSVAAIELYDIDSDSVRGSKSANAWSGDYTITSLYYGTHYYIVRLNITTASATSGATVDLDYVVVEVVYV